MQHLPWSERLQEQTRNTILELPLTLDGKLHFKSKTQGFAYANLLDLYNDRLVLYNKSESVEHIFQQINDLINAGWAID